MLIRLIFTVNLILLISCSSISKKELTIQERYDKANKYFSNKKFQKAKNEFQFIIDNEKSNAISLESSFYLAQSLFELKEYEEALYHFNHYSMFSKSIANIELAQFMKCKCLFKLTAPYENDQSQSFLCISNIQEFLDNFPNSKYSIDANKMIEDLREKISKKYYEEARLYLKMKKFEAAIYSLNIIFSNYYDTKYYDEAIITYIFTYILMDEYNEAKKYFELNKDNFNSNVKMKEAESILIDYKDGIGLSGLFRLYR